MSRTVSVGLPITALALCLGVAAHAKPIIQSAGDRSTLAAVALDGGAIAKWPVAHGGGNGGGKAAVTAAATAAGTVAATAAATVVVPVAATEAATGVGWRQRWWQLAVVQVLEVRCWRRRC